MRVSDFADPSKADDLASRMQEASERLEEERTARSREKKAIGALRHHARQLKTGANPQSNWKRIFDVLEEAVPDLIKPSDVRVRDLLVGQIDAIPADIAVPEQAQSVLESIDQFLSAEPATPAMSLGDEAPTKEVLATRDRLRGTKLVVIGGDARPYSKDALKEAFELAEVIWVTSRAHQSAESFKPVIQSPGVGAVLLAIRWSSHSFGVVRDYCAEANVPFVRLPAGYNPNQVASELVGQLSLPVA
jgi:hypothetical protein